MYVPGGCFFGRERAERQVEALKEEARILAQLLYKERSLAAARENEVLDDHEYIISSYLGI